MNELCLTSPALGINRVLTERELDGLGTENSPDLAALMTSLLGERHSADLRFKMTRRVADYLTIQAIMNKDRQLQPADYNAPHFLEFRGVPIEVTDA